MYAVFWLILMNYVLCVREYEFAGVERQTGRVEWTTGVEYWTGLLECHAHKSVHVHIKRYLEPWMDIA